MTGSRGLALTIVWLCGALLALAAVENRPVPPTLSAKIDPQLLEAAQTTTEVEALVWLVDQADLSQAAHLPDQMARGRYTITALQAQADEQRPLLDALKAAGVPYRSFWIANMVWVRAPLPLLHALADRPEVGYIFADSAVALAAPTVEAEANAPSAVEPNIALVNAPLLWAEGHQGQGVVIGGQDTGYNWDHPALINAYRGWNGTVADHNYNWHDAIHSGGSADCPANSPAPCDDYQLGHGSHTMGIMVGADGGTNQIGMAPAARWIGCRNMDEGVGQLSTYSECFEWFLAPTDGDGTNPDPARAPAVINNSWYCPPDEGCTDPTVLAAVVASVRAAGIVVVGAAGNSGPSCSTIDHPPAIFGSVLTVGATALNDTIASFSSRGPAPAGADTPFKPDITAPGLNIRSSSRFGGYYVNSGTSMAAPHAAGLVALLLSAQPALSGQVDYLEHVLRSSALPLTGTQTCAGVPGTTVPNHTFGYGRLDAWAALHEAPFQLDLHLDGPATVGAGAAFTYTVNARFWHTLADGHQLVVTDVIPVGTTFVTATLPHVISGDTITWSAAQLAPGGTFSAQLIVRALPTAPGVIVNDALVATLDEIDGLIEAEAVATIVVSDYSYLPAVLRP